MSIIKTTAIAAILATAAASANASSVILDTLSDAENAFNFQTNPGGFSAFNLITSSRNTVPFGQSFTLSDETENLMVEARLSTLTFPQPADVDVDATLVAGSGVTRDERLTVSFFEVGVTRDDSVLANFDFSSLGALQAGTYTVLFAGDGALVGGNQGVDTTGTDSFDANGAFDFGSNRAQEFGIRVTGDATAAPIPLPASLPLLLAGLGGFALVRRKYAA